MMINFSFENEIIKFTPVKLSWLPSQSF